MRILLVTPDYEGAGGIQHLTRTLESGLKDRGHTVNVLVDEAHSRCLKATDFIPKLRWLQYSAKASWKHWPHQLRIFKRTDDLVKRGEYDAVHVMHAVCWPALAAADRDTTSILSAHALELQSETRAKTAFGFSDRIHAVSDFTAGLVEEIDPEASPRITVIHPHIEVDSYAHSRGRRQRVCSVARLVERKNIETLIRAWRELDSKVRNEWDLQIAGDGPQMAHLQELASGFDSIELLGYINESDKNDFLAGSELFVLPATRDGYDVEGFGIVFIESQAAGTPVVGSKTGGVPEAVGDGGILLDNERDPTELAKRIKNLLQNQEKRQELEGNAMERIGDFDLECKIPEYENLYRK